MGNRLTLPLLLVAACLAGGAFFWLSGGERRAGRGAPAPVASEHGRADDRRVELQAPEVAASEPAAVQEPAREELSRPSVPQPAPRSEAGVAAVGVTGQVLDRFGTPVAAARVTLAANTGFPMDLELERDFPWLERQRTRTDAEGRFRFERVDPGSVQVAVRAHGFAPYEQRNLSVPSSDAELEPFVLTRGAILSGRVVDPDGRGVPGARIVRQDLGEGPALFMVGQREPVAVSADDGQFRVDELACGPWRFVVRTEEHPDLVAEGVSEQPGVEQGGLRWQLAPGATIAGTVAGVPAGERGALEVRATRGQSDEFLLGAARVAGVDPGGAFLLRGLEVGQSYNLQARRTETEDEFSFWERSRSNSVQARAGDGGVVLVYQPEAALTFSVADSATRLPLERFQVESGLDWTMPLRGDDGRPRTIFPGGVVRVGGLRPGSAEERVQLAVRATGYREYQRADIAVRAGQELDLGVVYLDPVPVLRVHVTDQGSGAPVSGATARIARDQGGSFSVHRSIALGDAQGVEEVDFGDGRSGTTDEHGWAEITSYEGETVKLTVRAAGYAPFALPGLQLPRGERLEHEVALTPGGEVLVHVVDARGLPLAGAAVEHRSGSGPEGGVFVMGGPRSEHVTDSEGSVLFTNLEQGLHSFRLTEDEGGPAFAFDTLVVSGLGEELGEEWSQVQVVERERVEVTLKAAPTAELTGRVREAGRVLAGATLRLAKEGGGGGPDILMPGMSGGPEAKSDGEGRYRFDQVKEGRYTLAVEHPTRRMPQEFALELREGENTFDVDLSLSILAGRVVDQRGQGVPGVKVWPERRAGGEDGTRMRMIMIADDGGGGVFDSGQFGGRSLTDADGRYTLRGVTSDVDLVVKAEGDTVQPGESEVVRVAPDETRENVDLRLEPAGSILVEARLADGTPARFQLVQAEFPGASPEAVQPKFAFLQSGSTTLKGLKPGRWRVSVRDAQGARGPGEPGQEQEIEVKAGETASASFEVE